MELAWRSTRWAWHVSHERCGRRNPGIWQSSRMQWKSHIEINIGLTPHTVFSGIEMFIRRKLWGYTEPSTSVQKWLTSPDNTWLQTELRRQLSLKDVIRLWGIASIHSLQSGHLIELGSEYRHSQPTLCNVITKCCSSTGTSPKMSLLFEHQTRACLRWAALHYRWCSAWWNHVFLAGQECRVISDVDRKRWNICWSDKFLAYLNWRKFSSRVNSNLELR